METKGGKEKYYNDNSAIRENAAESEKISRGVFSDPENYCQKDYEKDVYSYGLKRTWDKINEYVIGNCVQNDFLSADNFADMYETGLAIEDKRSKKYFGQYFTPDDVAFLMAEWFLSGKGYNFCDVACGTGKLILAVLEKLGKEKAVELIREGRLYLYDTDEVALGVLKTVLTLKYGSDAERFVHFCDKDFLSVDVSLPKDCKVISNPPYASAAGEFPNREKTKVAEETKELYSMFMEKIVKQSESSVVITPYSFLGGRKFYALRETLNRFNGFIVAFDNVPGNVFCGKKRGIFNTNTANSVRAAITVVRNEKDKTGFKISPLIRFKNEERERLFTPKVAEIFVDGEYQIVTKENDTYCKCMKDLRPVWNAWKNSSDKKLKEYLKESGKFTLSVPNTCRYFTAAYCGFLNRKGQITLKFGDKNAANYVFCMINSSFAYWYWRMFDGGITYQKSLLTGMPVFFDKADKEDILFFNSTAAEMTELAKRYTVTKNNVGIQENVKYPREFRDKINRRLLDILGVDADERIFDAVHSNMALKVNLP